MGNCMYSSPKSKKKKPVILRNQIRKKNIPKTLKRMVWDKYIGSDVGKAKCMCCKHQEIRQIEFHCGHVVAEANKGPTNIDNLRPICAQCNLSMGKMNMDLFMKTFMTNQKN